MYTIMNNDLITPENTPALSGERFHMEIMAGLSAHPKRLPSKYFYDETGDRLFQQIMRCPEYYLTRCELDIFQNKSAELIRAIAGSEGSLDIIELGAGDGTKTIHLLQKLQKENRNLRYIPIDISGHILNVLENSIRSQMPTLDIRPLEGDYFDMLGKAKIMSGHRKVLLFSGANIGNMTIADAKQFCIKLRHSLQKGDCAVIGFDLKKDPNMIRAAYDDQQGITRAFNLNLLARINRQLGGDFDLNAFTHYCNYDPETGTCKSYLISMSDQTVLFPDAEVKFRQGEYIHTEISQKYTLQEISSMAVSSGFDSNTYVADSNGWFVSAVWKA